MIAQAILEKRDSESPGFDLPEALTGRLVASGIDVLDRLAQCATHGLVIPLWLADQYLVRFLAVKNLEVASWDDEKAFGRPLPKGAQLKARREQLEKASMVFVVVHEFKTRHPKRAMQTLWDEFDCLVDQEVTDLSKLDAVLSEKVRNLGIRSTYAQALYAAELSRLGIVPPRKVQKVRG